jgi:glycosyltransferase involved in cell wall biosynthesis
MAALGARAAIVNSCAAARLVPVLQAAGLRATLLVHEMPKLLAEYNLNIQARLGAQAADDVVFASAAVCRAFCAALDVELPRAKILPQGNYQEIAFDPAARRDMRRDLGVGDKDFLVLGVGFGDLRKGFDIFVQLAAKILTARKNMHFAWLGEVQPVLKTYLSAEAAALGSRLRIIGFSRQVAAYYAAADAFALTSREDPYPTVALEALAAGLPVVAFDQAGGIPDLLREHRAGAVARPGDADDFRKKLLGVMDRAALAADRPRLMAMAAQNFDQRRYVAALVAIALPAQPDVAAAEKPLVEDAGTARNVARDLAV